VPAQQRSTVNCHNAEKRELHHCSVPHYNFNDSERLP
jgi:hypothetical protein